MKRFLLAALAAALLAATAGHLLRDRIAAAVFARALTELTARAAAHGLECRDLRYASVSIEGLAGTFIVHQPACRLRVAPGVVSGLGLGPDGEAAREGERILAEGRTDLDLSLAAAVTVPLGGTLHELRLRSEPDGVGTSLSIDPDDVRRLARAYTTPLTEAEIELVASHPARAPKLLRLSQQAEQVAAVHKSHDPRFPDDAYRHVYWSWLLAREYGPEFAARVTDAHEEGATYEFGEAQRAMDLRTNAVRRIYASAGVPAEELARRVLEDPLVVRSQAELAGQR